MLFMLLLPVIWLGVANPYLSLSDVGSCGLPGRSADGRQGSLRMRLGRDASLGAETSRPTAFVSGSSLFLFTCELAYLRYSGQN